MMLTFTQPVDTSSVSIAGNEPVTLRSSTSDTSLIVETILSSTGVATPLVMVVNTTVAAQVNHQFLFCLGQSLIKYRVTHLLAD